MTDLPVLPTAAKKEPRKRGHYKVSPRLQHLVELYVKYTRKKPETEISEMAGYHKGALDRVKRTRRFWDLCIERNPIMMKDVLDAYDSRRDKVKMGHWPATMHTIDSYESRKNKDTNGALGGQAQQFNINLHIHYPHDKPTDIKADFS